MVKKNIVLRYVLAILIFIAFFNIGQCLENKKKKEEQFKPVIKITPGLTEKKSFFKFNNERVYKAFVSIYIEIDDKSNYSLDCLSVSCDNLVIVDKKGKERKVVPVVADNSIHFKFPEFKDVSLIKNISGKMKFNWNKKMKKIRVPLKEGAEVPGYGIIKKGEITTMRKIRAEQEAKINEINKKFGKPLVKMKMHPLEEKYIEPKIINVEIENIMELHKMNLEKSAIPSSAVQRNSVSVSCGASSDTARNFMLENSNGKIKVLGWGIGCECRVKGNLSISVLRLEFSNKFKNLKNVSLVYDVPLETEKHEIEFEFNDVPVVLDKRQKEYFDKYVK